MTLYAFDSSDVLTNQLTTNLSKLSRQDTSKKDVTATYMIEQARLLPNIDKRSGIVQPFGQLQLQLDVHLDSFVIDGQQFSLLDTEGRDYQTRRDVLGDAAKLRNYTSHLYDLNISDVHNAIDSGLYTNFEQFNRYLNQELSGNLYSKSGKLEILSQELDDRTYRTVTDNSNGDTLTDDNSNDFTLLLTQSFANVAELNKKPQFEHTIEPDEVEDSRTQISDENELDVSNSSVVKDNLDAEPQPEEDVDDVKRYADENGGMTFVYNPTDDGPLSSDEPDKSKAKDDLEDDGPDL